jgi:hypothetical protein
VDLLVRVPQRCSCIQQRPHVRAPRHPRNAMRGMRHVQKASVFSAKVQNQACLSCHDGPIHHANQASTPDCATCHTEHRGRINIAATSEKSYPECHADLRTAGAASRYSQHIHNSADGHPEFAVIRENRRDPSTIKLNHALHLIPIRRGPIANRAIGLLRLPSPGCRKKLMVVCGC